MSGVIQSAGRRVNECDNIICGFHIECGLVLLWCVGRAALFISIS